jgi:hypothetical protein
MFDSQLHISFWFLVHRENLDRNYLQFQDIINRTKISKQIIFPDEGPNICEKDVNN